MVFYNTSNLMLPTLNRVFIFSIYNKTLGYLDHKYNTDINLEVSYPKLLPPDSDKIFYQCKINNRTIECYRLIRYNNYRPIDDSKLIGISSWIPVIFHSGIIYFEMIPTNIIFK